MAKYVFNPEDAREFTRDGAWFRDACKRYVLFRGANLGSRSKMAPYLPVYPIHISNFSKATLLRDLVDEKEWLDLLKSLGFNVVRLVVQWKGIAPDSNTVASDGYLDAVRAIVEELFKRGIYSLIDFHQDIAHEKYGGDGFPDWAITNPPKPPDSIDPSLGWSIRYTDVLQFALLPTLSKICPEF